jgi:hypothetical protein
MPGYKPGTRAFFCPPGRKRFKGYVRPLCSGGSFKPIAAIPNPRNQVARLLLGKAVFLRELAHFIILIGSHFATVRLTNLALVVHSSNATTGNAALFPLSPAMTRPDSDSL